VQPEAVRQLFKLLEGQSQKPTPLIHLNLNIDGRALAQAVSEQQVQKSTYQTDSPASNGAAFFGP
jgi:hypothetical protein